MKFSTLVQVTDYLLPMTDFEKTIKQEFHLGRNSPISRDCVVSIFIDELKTETGIGLEIYSDDLNISVSLRLPNIFQSGNLCTQCGSKQNYTVFFIYLNPI